MSKTLKKLGIIGCGAIGTKIAIAVDRKKINADLKGVYDIQKEKSIRLVQKLKNIKPEILDSIKEVVDISDIVIETANKDAVPEIAKIAIKNKKDVFVLSVGGLIENLWIFKEAKKNGVNIYYPSGAIAGLDGITAAGYGKISEILLRTTKPFSTFKNLSYVKNRIYGVEEKGGRKLIFKGNVKDAIKYFPQNINVAATISLKIKNFKKITIEIYGVDDRRFNKNIHEIEIKGDFGNIYTRTENVPLKDNPKTSYLAVLSSISLLNEICSK